ncbi:MAG: pyridoxal phosphate-dependent aminotransferase [bacterium]|nr:pyridoxal phosphate-dependent aminotransferase [bacterium]
MRIRLSKRVGRISPSITLEITAKVRAMQAAGHDVIGFGAGEPDFDTPEPIKEAAVRALAEGFTKYTPVGGIPELKAAIVEKFARENNLAYSPEEILVSCGAKHCLYNLFQACLEAGDEVLIPAPYWVSYPEMVALADATPIVVPPVDDGRFKISPDALRERITPRSRALIINSPSNPTGAAYTEEELRALAEVAEEADLLIVSDEIYERIVYDGFRPVSPAALSDEIKTRTMVVNGLSKTFSMTGWRLGYIAGDKSIVTAMTTIQSQSTSNPTSFAQRGAVEALRVPLEEVAAMVSEFARRRDVMVKGLDAADGFRCSTPQGAFYVFPDVSGLFGRRYKETELKGSADVAAFLLDEAMVAVIPGLDFGDDRCVRFSYATSLENIEEGLARIGKAVGKLA